MKFCSDQHKKTLMISLKRKNISFWTIIPFWKMQLSELIKWQKLIKVIFISSRIHFHSEYQLFHSLFPDVADHFIKISSCLLEMATADTNQLERFATKAADIFEKARVWCLLTNCLQTPDFTSLLHLSCLRKSRIESQLTKIWSFPIPFVIICETQLQQKIYSIAVFVALLIMRRQIELSKRQE